MLLITTRDAGQVRGHAKQTGVVPAVQPLQHQGHLFDRPDQRVGRQPLGQLRLARQRQLSRTATSQPLAWITTASAPPAGTTGTFLALNKPGGDRQRARHRRPAAHRAGLGQGQARLRHHALVTGDLHLRHLESTTKSDRADLSDATSTGQPTFGGVDRLCQQQIHLGRNPRQQRGLAEDRHQGQVRFRRRRCRATIISQDIQLNPFTVLPNAGVGYSQIGKITRMDGTNWQNGDAKGIWRPFGMTARRRSASAFTATATGWRIRSISRHSGMRAVRTGTGQLYSDRRRRDQHRRAVAAGRLEDPAQPEADAGRAAGKLARVRWLQRQHPDRGLGCDGNDREVVPDGAAPAQLHQLLAEGVAVLGPRQGLERHGQFRRGLALSDSGRAVSERDRRRRRTSCPIRCSSRSTTTLES